MSTTEKATPRPWRTAGRETERHAIRILNAEGGLVAEARAAGGSWEDSKRHAELIVTAVNAHTSLLALAAEIVAVSESSTPLANQLVACGLAKQARQCLQLAEKGKP